MSDALQSEQGANMAKGWVRAPLDIPPLPAQERVVEIIGAVDDQITALDTEAETETATVLQAGVLAGSLTTSQGEEWEEVRLSEVSSPLAGPAFKASTFASTPVGPRLLRGINLGRSGTRWDVADTMFWPEAEGGAFQKYVLEPGDVCIAMDRPFTRDRILRCGLIQNADLPALLVQRVTRLRANLNRIMPEFLIFVVQSPSMAERLAGRQTPGGYAPHISGRDISEFTFALPPLSVQERIVEVISAVDDQITTLDAEASTARRLLNMVLAEHFAAVEGEPYRIVDLCSHVVGGVWGKPEGEGEIDRLALGPRIYTPGTSDFVTDGSPVRSFTTKQADTRTVQEQDIILERSGGSPEQPVGRVAIAGPDLERCVPTDFQRLLRVDSEKALPRYVFWRLRHDWVSGLTHSYSRRTTGITNLSVKDYIAREVPVPSLEEQAGLVESAEAVDALVVTLRAEAASLRQVRAGLLSGLLGRTIDIESAELEV